MAREGIDRDAERFEAQRRGIQERERLELAKAFAFVMGDERGRMFVRWMLLVSEWDMPAMTGNSQTFANLGKQEVGRMMRDTLRQSHWREWQTLDEETRRDAELKTAAQIAPK